MKPLHYYNQTQTNLAIPGIEESMTVVAIQCLENRFNKPYRYHIEMISETEIKLPTANTLSNRLTQLTWQTANGTQIIPGFIHSYNALGQTGKHFHYQFELCSPWLNLNYSRTYQGWTDESPTDIIYSVIKSALPCPFKWTPLLKDPIENYPQVLQYELSHWEFIKLLCERFGLIPFTHWDGMLQIGVTDDIRFLSQLNAPIDLHFQDSHAHAHEDEQSFFELQSKVKLGPGKTTRLDYQPNDPSTLLENSASSQLKLKNTGTVQEHGIAESTYWAKRFCTSQQIARDSHRQLIHISTDCRDLHLGQVINLSHFPDSNYDKAYRVISLKETIIEDSDIKPISTSCKNKAAFPLENFQTPDELQSPKQPKATQQETKEEKENVRFKAEVTLIPASQEYLLFFDDNNPALKKDLLLPAKLVATKHQDAYPDIDQEGRYRASYFFKNSSEKPYETPPMRALMPYGGKVKPLAKQPHGWQMGLRPGTDVLLVINDGIFHAPKILGVMPHPKQPSVTNQSNSTQHRLRTFSGHETILNDDPQEPFVKLNTKNTSQSLFLQATPGEHQTSLINKTGDMHHESKGDLSIQAKNQTTKVKGHHHIQAASVNKLTEQGNIETLGEQSFEQTAAQDICWQTQKGDIKHQSKTHTSETQGELQCLAIGRKLTLSAPNGNLNIKSKQLNIRSARVKLGGAAIQGNQANINGTLKAPNIDVFQPIGKGPDAQLNPFLMPKMFRLPKSGPKKNHVQPLIALNFREDLVNDYFGEKKPKTKDGKKATKPKKKKDPYKLSCLSGKDLSYFQQNGNNVTIFIHGFGVEYGEFGQEVHVDPQDKAAFNETIYSRQDIYRDPEHLASSFPSANLLVKNEITGFTTEEPFDPFNLNHRKVLNGTGAHSWWLHMENNLNLMTQQLNKSNYENYTRCLHIAWQGDPNSPLDYLAAVETAKKAAIKLKSVVEDLKKKGIQINIIAHSLGNAVLIELMNLLGQEGQENIINQAFMWEAAIPNNSFSSPASNEAPCKLYDFPDAYKAAKNIHVLFSYDDFVLGPSAHDRIEPILHKLYRDPTVGLGQAGSELFIAKLDSDAGLSQEMQSPYIFANYFTKPFSDYLRNKQDRVAYYEYIKAHYKQQDAQPYCQSLEAQTKRMEMIYPNSFESVCALLKILLDGDLVKGFIKLEATGLNSIGLLPFASAIESIKLCLRQTGLIKKQNPNLAELAGILMTLLLSYGPKPVAAMGYSGPDMKEALCIKLQKEGSLTPFNQRHWLMSHSGMEIPTPALMKHVYHDKIFMAPHYKFGRYKKSKKKT